MEHVHETGERRRVRSLFISDVHVGSRFAQAEAFPAFLEAFQPEFLYIVGISSTAGACSDWQPVNSRRNGVWSSPVADVSLVTRFGTGFAITQRRGNLASMEQG